MVYGQRATHIKLKIAYINIGCGVNPDSTQLKVTKQIKYLSKLNHHVSGIFFSTEINTITKLNENIALYPVNKSNGLFKSYKQIKNYFKAIELFLNYNSHHYDLIYFRYQGSNAIMYKIVIKYKEKLCLEFVSNNIDNIKEYRKYNKPRFSISSILSQIEFYYLPLINEIIFSKKIRKIHQCFVTESIDFYNFWKNKSGIGKIISNGFDTANIELKSSKNIGDEIVFFMLTGSSQQASYNGIERLLESFNNYNGNYKLKLIVAGNLSKPELLNNKFIEYIGYLKEDEIFNVSQKCNIGVSPLSCYIKNMFSATPLRTRAYFTYGLPILNSVNDTDFEKNPVLKKYVIQVKNDNSTIDIEKVISSYKEISKEYNFNINMNDLAQKYLSWDSKMNELSEFLVQFLYKKIN